MFKAMGLTDDDLERPLIGVANTWTELTPCNLHLRDLAVHVKDGIRAAGGTPFEFNTITISDGITMGSEGMRASLVSREIVADSIELVVSGHILDGVVAISGCDKTIPGTVMALARLEAKVAFETLLARYPQMSLVDQKPAWQVNNFVRGLESLPIHLNGGAPAQLQVVPSQTEPTGALG